MNNQPATLDLKKLREVALAATPGPWHSPGLNEVHDADHNTVAETHLFDEDDNAMEEESDANAEFIATLNPQTILALLDAYEASARDAERYRWLRSFRCPSNRYPHITQWPDPSSSVPQVFGGEIPSRENLDKAIDAARHATQGD